MLIPFFSYKSRTNKQAAPTLGTWQAAALQSAQSKMACLLQLPQQGNAMESCFVKARANRRKTVLARVQATLKPTKETRKDHPTAWQAFSRNLLTYLLTYLPTNLVSQTNLVKVLTIQACITFVQNLGQT